MKKKSNILTFLLLLFSLIAFAACKEETNVDIKGFEFETKTAQVQLGDFFYLPELVVYDTSGTVYSVDYEVSHLGQNVDISFNSFKATKLGKYTLTAKINVGSNVRTLTMEITCSDTLAPVISTPNFTKFYYTTGDIVSLKTISVLDNSGSAEYGISVFYNGEDVTLEDFEFTAAKQGIYEIVITANDVSGNNTTETIIVDAIDPPKQNEIAAFVSESTLYRYNMKVSEGVTSELTYGWTDKEVGGKSGGLFYFNTKKRDVEGYGKYNYMRFNPVYSFEYYQGLKDEAYTHIIIPIYVTGTDKNVKVYKRDKAYKRTLLSQLELNAWNEVRMELDFFIDNQVFKTEAGMISFDVGGTEEDYTVYIGSIFAFKKPYTPAVNEVLDFDHALKLEESGIWATRNLSDKITYGLAVQAVGGSDGPFFYFNTKLKDIDGYSAYNYLKFKPLNSKAHYEALKAEGYTHIEIPIYVTGTSKTVTLEYRSRAYTRSVLKKLTPDTWHYVTLEIDEYLDSLEKEFIFKEGIFLFNLGGAAENYTVYIGGIYCSK